jgi:hypothetical protein
VAAAVAEPTAGPCVDVYKSSSLPAEVRGALLLIDDRSGYHTTLTTAWVIRSMAQITPATGGVRTRRLC